jgi:hypothetical protein
MASEIEHSDLSGIVEPALFETPQEASSRNEMEVAFRLIMAREIPNNHAAKP